MPHAISAADRALRDQAIMKLFISGWTWRQIADNLHKQNAGWKISHTAVGNVIKKQLKDAAANLDLLSDEALAIHQTRLENLLRAHWNKALGGDVKSAEFCRRVLVDQARLYDLEELGNMPRVVQAPPPPIDGDDDKTTLSRIDQYRSRRSGA